MALFKRRGKTRLDQAQIDILAQQYIEHEADRLLESQPYKEFVSWAERNGLHPVPEEGTRIPWQVIDGKKFTLQFFPVILAGSDPVEISYFHVSVEDVTGLAEPMVEQCQPSIPELQEVLDGIRNELDGPV